MFSFDLLTYQTLRHKICHISFHTYPLISTLHILIHLCYSWGNWKLDRCASSSIDFLKFSSLRTHSLPRNLATTKLSTFMSFDFSMISINSLSSSRSIFTCSIKSFDITKFANPVTCETRLIEISSPYIAYNLQTC